MQIYPQGFDLSIEGFLDIFACDLKKVSDCQFVMGDHNAPQAAWLSRWMSRSADRLWLAVLVYRSAIGSDQP